MMKVCIAEKPSVAYEIAQIVGAKSKRDGYYEGNNYRVTWTFGHLCSLKEPHDYLPEWKRWSLGTLPIIPKHFGIKVLGDKGVQKQFSVIETLMKDAQEVINCGDAGQEGEVIQRWVLQKAGCKCPIRRLWISSLTEESIREGFQNLKDGKDFDRLYAAGSSRAIGDWLLGINATRLYTLKYAQQGQVLSIGRVQTPSLALIVDRQKQIDHFVPEPFWELKTEFKGVVFSSTKGRFVKKEEGELFLAQISEKEFEVTDFSRKQGKESPPKLFDLTSLQVECNKRFGLSADETLKSIQGLYEKKLTTYPRVDTTYLSNDIYPKIPGILKGLKAYSELVAPLLKEKIRKSKKVFDDKKVTDHHAIIPTGMQPGNLNRDEQIVYDVVVRRFLCNFYPDSIVSNTTVLGVVENVDFKVSGKQIIDEAWRVVVKSGTSKVKGEEGVLPAFSKGEKGAHRPQLHEKETQPPKPYSEATLLRAMETAGKQVDDEELRELMKENGIGRPSTRAAIIETLFKRKYIQKVRKNLHPTITGTQLIDNIRNELLKSAELTGLWEQKLRQIETGEYEAGTFMAEMKQMVSDVVVSVKRDYSARRIESVEESEKKRDATSKKKREAPAGRIMCPKCGKGEMIKGNAGWGCSMYKDGCKTVVPFEFMGKKMTDSQFKQLIKNRKTSLVKGFVENGEKVNGYITFDDGFCLKLEKEVLQVWRCPRCQVGEVLKGKSAFGCSNYKNGCLLRIPFEFMGKKLTTKQVESLVLKGKTSKLKGFEKDGNLLDGVVQFDENYQLKLE